MHNKYYQVKEQRRRSSQAFEDCLSRKGILDSFSRKGNSYDNACIESFHSVLKKEEISGVKAKLASGEQPVFDSVDALFDKLEAE